jgi:hypothetical protein
VLVALIGEEFGASQSQTRCNNALNAIKKLYLLTDPTKAVHFSLIGAHLRWIIGQIEEQTNIFHGSILLKILLKEPCCFHVDSHRGEDNGKVVVSLGVSMLSIGQFDKTSLAHNLGSNLHFLKIIFKFCE